MLDLHMVKKSDSFFSRSDGRPYVIAGPCSAESRQQMLDAVLPLRGLPGLGALRAGIWKPRTRPGSFEGIGREALPWLVEAGKELDLPVAAEVAKPDHVEACLREGVDILWVGARTTVNPFYVQELAESLKGTDVSVLVKNPIHPEIGLWLGALERFDKAGIQHLGAVHRGYFSLNAAPYRNEPGWELAIELKEHNPELPVIVDPSHISGKRKLVTEIAQIGMELGLDGLMVEVHADPDNALSDAAQQLLPTDLQDLLGQIRVRKQIMVAEDTPDAIKAHRQRIDAIDKEILSILQQRLEEVRAIGLEKEKTSLALFQWGRWTDILRTRREIAEALNIDAAQAEELFRILHKHALNEQVNLVHRPKS